jgi:hypothetical protein
MVPEDRRSWRDSRGAYDSGAQAQPSILSGAGEPGTVVHGQNLDVLVTHPVDDAVVAHNDLPGVLRSELPNDSPQTWKMLQLIGGMEHAVSEHRRYLRRVAGNGRDRSLRDHRQPGKSTLLQPFDHALADLLLTDQFTAIGLAKASFDLVEQVQAIEGIFNPSVIRQIVNCLQYLLLGLHGTSAIHFVSQHRASVGAALLATGSSGRRPCGQAISDGRCLSVRCGGWLGSLAHILYGPGLELAYSPDDLGHVPEALVETWEVWTMERFRFRFGAKAERWSLMRSVSKRAIRRRLHS